MQPPVPIPGRAVRFDTRSLIAAGFCVAALFFDWFGWLFAITGIILLRRAAFSGSTKWLLAAVAILPKIVFAGVRSMYAPAGLSFPIEPRNLTTSSSLWAWSVLLAAAGVLLMLASRRTERTSMAAPQKAGPPGALVFVIGLAAVAGAAVMLLGLTDGFHRIDDAGGGRWALRHAARGNVAVFAAREVAGIEGEETYVRRRGYHYSVKIALNDGRSFSASTATSGVLDELRTFATTANLPPGRVRIALHRGGTWTNGSGFTVKNCIGKYEHTDAATRSQSTYEFWLDGERLAGKETTADPQGRHVRVLRNIKLSDSGKVEFLPAGYVEASQQPEKGTMKFSFAWSSSAETAQFVNNGLDVGTEKYVRTGN